MTRDEKPSETEIESKLASLDSDRREIQRSAADQLSALAKMSEDVRTTLLGGLRSASRKRRWGAAYALAQAGYCVDGVVLALLEALGSADADIRWAAAALLSAGSDLDGRVDALLGVGASGNPIQRRMVAYTLRDLAPTTHRVENAILERLVDEDRLVRLAALTALPILAVTPERCAAEILSTVDRGDAGIFAAGGVALCRLAARSETVEAVLAHAQLSGDPLAAQALARHHLRRCR